MSLSATNEFMDVCKKAIKQMQEVDTIYDMYEYILDKEELRRDDKVMDFLSQYKYDIHREVSESLYGGKKRKYSKRRRPKRKNKTRSKR